MPKAARHNLFLAYCWGGAGSTWLAWALNSHKDILCLHAPNFPRFDRHKQRDAMEIVRAFYSLPALGSSYRCVGFTHAIRREWHNDFVKEYGDRLRGFILTRHPIKRINSLTALNANRIASRNLTLRERLGQNRSYARLMAASRRTDFPRDGASMGFYHSCHAVGRIMSEVATGLPIYRFEDLVGSAEKFQGLLDFVSDGTLTMSSDEVRELQATVKGKHAPRRLSVQETYEAWSDVQKRAFAYLVKPQALQAYVQLGYEFPEAARVPGPAAT